MKTLNLRSSDHMVKHENQKLRISSSHISALFIWLLFPATIFSQVTGEKYNYQVNAVKTFWAGDDDPDTFVSDNDEEPTLRAGVCPDPDNDATQVIPDYNSATTTCGSTVFTKLWSADCTPSCESTWTQKLYSQSTGLARDRIDLCFRSWEDDDGPQSTWESGDDDRAGKSVSFNITSRISTPSTWSNGTHFSQSANNSSALYYRVIWRYHQGDDKNTAFDFQTLGTSTYSHTNSNRSNPASSEIAMGYTNKWTASSSPDVFYKFTVPAGGKRVIISKNISELRLRLLNGSTNGTNSGQITSSIGSITKDLCAGVYYIVVEGRNASQTATFTLTVKPDPIPVSAGAISPSKTSVCQTVSLGTISNTTLATAGNETVVYQWYRQEQGGSEMAVGGNTSTLSSSFTGTMPSSSSVNWVRFRRRAAACGANYQYTSFVTINKIQSTIDPGSIRYLPDGTTASQTEGPYTIPIVTNTTNINPFDSFYESIGANHDDASGDPGPINMSYEIVTPTESNWTQVSTPATNGYNWTPSTGGNNPFTASGTYKVRRKATNNCGATAYSNEIIIFVQDKYGSISGEVNTPSGSAVIGATITATLTNTIEGGAFTSQTYTVVTTSNGYTIPNIYYGSDADKATFTVTPSYTVNGTVHEFSPTSESVNVQDSPNNITLINFTDNTSLSIAGKVSQYLDGVECGMDTVAIHVNGIPTDSTDVNGDFSISVDSPGDYAITAVYKDQTFELDYSGNTFGQAITIDQNITGFNFTGTTMHTIEGKLTDGCGASIGEATIRFQDLNNCWVKDVQTVNNGFLPPGGVTLPGREYKIFVREHNNPLVNQFFSAALYVDLSEKDTSGYDFKYRAQPVVSLSGLPMDLGCTGDYNDVPLMEQVGIYPYTIEIKELALSGPNTCPVDTGTVQISDAIGERGLITLEFKDGMLKDTIIAGGPNLISPHLKLLSMVAMDTVNNTLDSEPMMKNALVTGVRATASNFDLVTPELPMMILRDPPGDLSFSFAETVNTHEVSTSMYNLKANSNNKWGAVALGTQFEAGFIGFDVETKIWNNQQLDVKHGSRNVSTNETVTTTTTSSSFSTSDNDLIVGEEGDLIIGASMVMNYSTADIVSYDNCAVALTKELIVAPKAVNTQYFLTTGHIRSVTIPSLQNKVDNPPNPDSLMFYKDQVRIWEHILEYNDSLKNEAVPFVSGMDETNNTSIPANIVLSGATGAITYSVSSASSTKLTTEFITEIDKDIANEIGAEVAGIGASGGYLINMKTETGKVSSTDNTEDFTTGFTILDDDAGDQISFSVLSDPVFKTPVFKLNSGQTSCPWEPGTQKRDDVQLLALNPIEANIPDGGQQIFNMNLGNISETGETRNFFVRINQESNDGAEVRINGAFEVEVPFNNIASGGTGTNFPVRVEQFDEDKYTFEGLEIEAYPVCYDEGAFQNGNPQISNIALISAYFMGPCTDVTMAFPQENWVINSNMTTIPVKINGYTKAGLTEVHIEYSEKGSNNWINAMVIPAANLLPNNPAGVNLGTTVNLVAANIPDGEYYLRLKSVCSNGINNYSVRALGIKDTKAPELLGLAEPIDDVYDPGDMISTSFDELVKASNLSNAMVEFIRLDDADANMGPLPATLGLFSNFATITPNQAISEPFKSPGAYRVVLTGIEDLYGNVSEPLSWVFTTPGYELTDECSALDISNNNNNQDGVSVFNYKAISITSDGTIQGVGSTKYLASKDVQLNGNFEVLSGGEFVADIVPCEDDLCQDVTSSSGLGNAPSEYIDWNIEEEGDCVSGILFRSDGLVGDVYVYIGEFTGPTEDSVNVSIVLGSATTNLVLDATGTTVDAGKYITAGGVTYGVELILSYMDGTNNSKIVVATVKMTVLPPDVIAPVIAIDMITGDDIIDALDAYSPFNITGSSDAENGQTVTVGLNGNMYSTQINQGDWTVTVPQQDVEVLLSGTLSVTADVTDFSGNVAVQATRSISVNLSTPAQYPISGIDYYNEFFDPEYPGPSSPLGEEMDKLIDGDVTTKYLNFNQDYYDSFFDEFVNREGTVEVILDLTSQETPSQVSVTTANDVPGRDPQQLTILGSNDGLSFDILGSTISIECIEDRYSTRVYDINNSTPYQYYVLQFLNKCDLGANSMQLAEVALWSN